MTPPKRPNLVFIMSDDHASHAISAYSADTHRHINDTPNLDRIAAGGMRMDSVFCTNSICTPSRAAILTGTYNHVNGVTTLATEMDNSAWTFPQAMQAAGYRTGMFGKWHLGTGARHNPVGFDFWRILPGQGTYFDPVMIEGRHDPGTFDVRERYGYVTDIITDDTLGFLDRAAPAARDGDAPFAVFCHHKAPHRSWEPDEAHHRMYDDVDIPEPETMWDDLSGRPEVIQAVRMRMRDLNWRDLKGHPPAGLSERDETRWRYQRYIKDYLRVVASIDDNVGRVLDRLDQLGVADDTVVIYTSDQGFFLGDHGWFDKRLMYEESLSMPFLIRYPRLIAPGSNNDDIVVNVDLARTILDLCGRSGSPVEVPSHVQGRSFVPLLEGETPDDWPEAMYYRYWMHRDFIHRTPAHFGVRTRTHKLIVYYNDPLDVPGAMTPADPPEWELYDLVDDPYEVENRIDDPRLADVRAELWKELRRLQDELGDEVHPAVANGPPG